MTDYSKLSNKELEEIINDASIELEDRMAKEALEVSPLLMEGDFICAVDMMKDYVDNIYNGEENPANFKDQLFNKVGELIFGNDFVTWLYRQG